MRLTALKQQVKNPERVSIFVDGKYSFSLSLDQLVKYKLKNNDELSEADVKKFKRISEDGKLKDRALAWLLNRPHSTREFHDYMRRKKADVDLSEKLAQEFTDRKYLNDERYAEWLVGLRSRAGKSNRAILSELFAKGIDREVSARVLENSEDDEVLRLRAMIAKKQKLSRYANDELKLIKYLTSQGFSYSLIKEQLKISEPEE